MRRLALALALLLASPAVAHATATGPMKIVPIQGRPGPCAVAGTIQTGIAYDDPNLLISCWSSPSIDVVSTDGVEQGEITVSGLPGPGIGAVAYDGTKVWVCAINNKLKQAAQARSNQVGYVDSFNTFVPVLTAPHGCVNNLQVFADGSIWADGTYSTALRGSSAYIDTFAPDLTMTTQQPWTPDGWVSGAIPGWEADNYSKPKTVSCMTATGPTVVEKGTLRFEQLTRDPSGNVYVKWYNQPSFGVFTPGSVPQCLTG